MMGYGDMGFSGWWMVIGGGLVWLLFLVTVGVVLWAAVRSHGQQTEGAPRTTPLDTLKVRYARGEITRTEFEQARQDLT